MTRIPDIVETLYDEQKIAVRVNQIAREIRVGLGSDVLVVAILKGSFVFTADLIRALHHAGVHPQVDFMQLSSYGSDKESSGKIEVLRDVTDRVQGREVLLVDDILDSGRTLAYARESLTESGAQSVRLCVLLDKRGRRVLEIEADFVGFDCPDDFVVGYGLDYANFYRELPYIGILSPDVQ